MGLKALVTGAGGFIGSHLARYLAREGYDVRAMVHYNSVNSIGRLASATSDERKCIDIRPFDICDPFAVSQAVKGMDVVFNLAALIGIPYSYISPASYVEVNVKGMLNVLQACREHETARLVQMSTSETYGTARYTPIDENHPLIGQSPYSASKIAADKLAESYHLSFGLPVTIARTFNTYGPGQSMRAVIPTVIIQALDGREQIELGSLEPIRDMLYVADTVRGLESLSRCDPAIGRAVNLGYGQGRRISDIAQAILDACGSRAGIVSRKNRKRPPNSEVMALVCDNRLAANLIQWSPGYDLERGLGETVAWFRKNKAFYQEISEYVV